MMFKALVLLAVGAYAQNDREGFSTVDGGCTPVPGELYPWCFELVSPNNVSTTQVMFRNNADDAASVDIVVGTNGENAAWCAWGVSDSGSMLQSSVIAGFGETTGGIPDVNTDPATFDLVIGDQRVPPTPADEANRQGVGSVITVAVEGNFGISFTRPRMVPALGAARQLNADVFMVAACGTEFGTAHDIARMWFQVNADTGALTAANPDGAASSLGAMSAALIVTVGVVFSSLW